MQFGMTFQMVDLVTQIPLHMVKLMGMVLLLKIHTPAEASTKWGTPESIADLTQVFINYLSGKVDVVPWADSSLSPETALIQEELFQLNEKDGSLLHHNQLLMDANQRIIFLVGDHVMESYIRNHSLNYSCPRRIGRNYC